MKPKLGACHSCTCVGLAQRRCRRGTFSAFLGGALGTGALRFLRVARAQKVARAAQSSFLQQNLKGGRSGRWRKAGGLACGSTHHDPFTGDACVMCCSG